MEIAMDWVSVLIVVAGVVGIALVVLLWRRAYRHDPILSWGSESSDDEEDDDDDDGDGDEELETYADPGDDDLQREMDEAVERDLYGDRDEMFYDAMSRERTDEISAILMRRFSAMGIDAIMMLVVEMRGEKLAELSQQTGVPVEELEEWPIASRAYDDWLREKAIEHLGARC